MGNKGVAVVEPDQQVFGAPVDGPHGAALDAVGELAGQRQAQVAATLDQPDDASADKFGYETAANGFDFGKFGHARRRCTVRSMNGQQRLLNVLRAAVTMLVGGISLVTALSWLAALHWTFELLVHFSFYFFLASAALALAALSLRLLRAAGLAALIAAVSFTTVWPHMHLPPSDLHPLPVPVVRILSINLHNWKTDLVALRSLIEKEKPDIAVFTELAATHEPVLRDLQTLLPFQSPVPRGNSFGIMLLARKPPESLAFDLALGEKAPLMVARLCPAGPGCLTLIALHAWRPFPYSDGARDRQLAKAGEVARRHVDKGERVVLLGDLNVTPFSPVFSRLVAQSGLVDSATMKAELARASTSTWWLGNTGIGLPIDHALVSPGIGIVARRLGPNIRSDHLPLILDLRIAP